MVSAQPASCRESGVRVTEFSTWGVRTLLRSYVHLDRLQSVYVSPTYGQFCKVVNSSEMVEGTSEVDFKAGWERSFLLASAVVANNELSNYLYSYQINSKVWIPPIYASQSPIRFQMPCCPPIFQVL